MRKVNLNKSETHLSPQMPAMVGKTVDNASVAAGGFKTSNPNSIYISEWQKYLNVWNLLWHQLSGTRIAQLKQQNGWDLCTRTYIYGHHSNTQYYFSIYGKYCIPKKENVNRRKPLSIIQTFDCSIITGFCLIHHSVQLSICFHT